MKKIAGYLHNTNVQGAIIITMIFSAVALATILTWGK
jgi:hypothetical protein